VVLAPELGIEGWRSEIDENTGTSAVQSRGSGYTWGTESGCVLHRHAVVAEAVWLCSTAALLLLGRQSNEDKRQCKAGDEGKTKDACLRSDLRFLGLLAGSRGIGVGV
jgi:hypothetical protein